MNIVKNYSAKQLMWADKNYKPNFNNTLTLDLNSIEPSLAGPKRPQDKILLKNVPSEFNKIDQNKDIMTSKQN